MLIPPESPLVHFIGVLYPRRCTDVCCVVTGASKNNLLPFGHLNTIA